MIVPRVPVARKALHTTTLLGLSARFPTAEFTTRGTKPPPPPPVHHGTIHFFAPNSPQLHTYPPGG